MDVADNRGGCRASVQRTMAWNETKYETRHMLYDMGKVAMGFGAGLLTTFAVGVHQSMRYAQEAGLHMLEHSCTPLNDVRPELRICNESSATNNMTGVGGESSTTCQLGGFILGAALVAVPTAYFIAHRAFGPKPEQYKGGYEVV